MPQAFRTKKGAEGIGISGVGGLAANGGSVLSIEEASKTMAELQETDAAGRIVFDDAGQPVPLTGAALTKAAKEWAEGHEVEVVNVKEEEFGESDAELLRQHSIKRYEDVYANLVPVNTNPEELTIGGADQSAVDAASRSPESEIAKED